MNLDLFLRATRVIIHLGRFVTTAPKASNITQSVWADLEAKYPETAKRKSESTDCELNAQISSSWLKAEGDFPRNNYRFASHIDHKRKTTSEALTGAIILLISQIPH